jgi:hypothetical protein
VPYTLVTSTATAASIEDLVEDTTYLVRWRSHPRPPTSTKGAAMDVGPVWGWGIHSAPVTVVTPRSHVDAVARRVRRRKGTQPSPHSVEIDWECLSSGPKYARGAVYNASAPVRVVVGGRFGKWWPAAAVVSTLPAAGGSALQSQQHKVPECFRDTRGQALSQTQCGSEQPLRRRLGRGSPRCTVSASE